MSSSPPAAVALGLATSFQVSQAIAVAVKLGVPDLFAEGAMTSSDVARITGTSPDFMKRLLRVLAAFDILKDLGDTEFELTQVGDCLRDGVPGSIRSLVLMFGSDTFWQTAASLGECLKTGKNGCELLHGKKDIFDYLGTDPEFADIFDNAMTGRSALTGLVAAQAYDFTGIEHVIDIAGGRGKMLASILKMHSHLRGTLYDLPRVVETASSFLVDEGVADRCCVMGGDMFASTPTGGDLYFLARVIHDWDDNHATQILQSCRRAMAPGAKLLILDRVLSEETQAGPAAQSHAVLDLTMMLWTAGGRERTATEFETIIGSSGLRLERIIPLNIPESLLEVVPA